MESTRDFNKCILYNGNRSGGGGEIDPRPPTFLGFWDISLNRVNKKIFLYFTNKRNYIFSSGERRRGGHENME